MSYKERMITERAELVSKTEGLRQALRPGSPFQLDEEDKALLREQLGHMLGYLLVLNQRCLKAGV